tara:strand:+ start:633 stop:758 length:126 start_codon:yes stop_codon:yes gene_type:complete
MKKKIYIILIISFLLVSCGKKGDPEYKKNEAKKISTTWLML